MSEKKSLEEQISKHTLANNVWVEPMRQWLRQAVLLRKTAKSGNFVAIKDALLKIDGLNLFLKTKKAQPMAAQTLSPPKNIWSALRAAKEKAALSGDNFQFSSVMVPRAGLEPARASAHRILSPACLPIPPPRHTQDNYAIVLYKGLLNHIVCT